MLRKLFKGTFLTHVFIILVGFVMIYPLLWMLSSSFKPSEEIFSTKNFFPKIFTLENYIIGWKGFSGYSFSRFYLNSFFVVFMCVIGTILSSTMAAYAFSKLEFSLKKPLFALMMLTVMLPAHVTLIPRYIIFNKLHWINTYLPLIVPKFFGVEAFFIFLLVQYMRTLPKELSEAAKIDGCSEIMIFIKLILPLSVPAIMTTGILTFLWTWNDFFSQLLYLSDVPKFTIAIALRMFIDTSGGSSWGSMFAMSVVSLVPLFLIFIFFQRYLIEGITAGSIKG
ncbi:MAG: carbohydrate ABC transporter permease [Clostridiales bacterium]|nr:carbohydrate ABC transporter permease [Clostridiales bacterium]